MKERNIAERGGAVNAEGEQGGFGLEIGVVQVLECLSQIVACPIGKHGDRLL